MKRGVLCRLAALFPEEISPRALNEHRRSCLRCQTETARYRSWSRELAAWRAVVVPVPDGFRTRVLAGLGAQDAADPRRALAGAGVAIDFTLPTATAANLDACLRARVNCWRGLADTVRSRRS